MGELNGNLRRRIAQLEETAEPERDTAVDGMLAECQQRVAADSEAQRIVAELGLLLASVQEPELAAVNDRQACHLAHELLGRLSAGGRAG